MKVVVKHHSKNTIHSTARYSRCERYRYELIRRWTPQDECEYATFICCNPSKATEVETDNTVTRCINFARKWGCGGFVMLNAFGLRSTDPKELRRVDDPVGASNDAVIRESLMTLKSKFVVLGWGCHARHFDRHSQMLDLIQGIVPDPLCLAVTKGGFPKHPLYIANGVTPFVYPVKEAK